MGKPNDSKFERDPEVLWRTTVGGVLLMPTDSADTLFVKTPGDAVWELLNEARTLDEIARALVRVYDVSLETVSSDVATMMQRLIELGVVRTD